MKKMETNVLGMIGVQGMVTTRVGEVHEPGYVKVHGEEWRAISTGPAIDEGICVVIKSVSGATVTVEQQRPVSGSSE